MHLAEGVEGKNHLTELEAISEPSLNLKLFVFDSIRDVLQKEKGKRERKKKAESNHKPSLQTCINS